jgi:hypothetical protein
MELGEAVMWIIGGLLIAGMLLVLYMSMDIKRIAEEESDAPYKLEPAEQLAVSEQPKKRGRPVGSKNKQPTRGYTKRSSYWTDKRKRAAAKKARQEKIKTARAKAREAVGH